MRWLKSLTFISLMALVLAETPSLVVRGPLIRQPLIKLAVQPAIAAEPLEVAEIAEVAETPDDVAPVAPVVPVVPRRSIMPYVGAPQYWPGYGSENWYGYNPQPYWGGYGQMRQMSQMRPRNYRNWGRRYWGPRVVVPVDASTVAPVTDTDAGVQVVADTDALVDTAIAV